MRTIVLVSLLSPLVVHLARAEPIHEFACGSFETRNPVALIRFAPPLSEKWKVAGILVLPSTQFVLARIHLEGLETRIDWANSENQFVYSISVGPDVSRFYDFTDTPPDEAIRPKAVLRCTSPQPMPIDTSGDSRAEPPTPAEDGPHDE